MVEEFYSRDNHDSDSFTKINGLLWNQIFPSIFLSHIHTHLNIIYIYIYIYIYLIQEMFNTARKILVNKSWRQHPTKK